MSSAKYTTKLVADTSQHDKALGKSKQQVYNYQKGVEQSKKEFEQFTGKIKNGAVGALSKFAVGVGATTLPSSAVNEIAPLIVIMLAAVQAEPLLSTNSLIPSGATTSTPIFNFGKIYTPP